MSLQVLAVQYVFQPFPHVITVTESIPAESALGSSKSILRSTADQIRQCMSNTSPIKMALSYKQQQLCYNFQGHW